MFRQTKSAVEGADSLHLLARVEQKLDEIIKAKESYKKSPKPLEEEEKKRKGFIQAKNMNAKVEEKEAQRLKKIKEKEKRFETAQDKILKGKERMRPTRILQEKKKKKEQTKVESDSFDDQYFEGPAH